MNIWAFSPKKLEGFFHQSLALDSLMGFFGGSRWLLQIGKIVRINHAKQVKRTFFSSIGEVEGILEGKFGNLHPQDFEKLKPLLPIRSIYQELCKIKQEEKAVKNEIEAGIDKEMSEFFQQELSEIRLNRLNVERQLFDALTSFEIDLCDTSEAMLEIRAGTGGIEAANFAFEIQQMYQKYCLMKNWNWCIVDEKQETSCSLREGIYMITGKESFSHLQSEIGVHRVQRVPSSENSGRIHTSTISVALIPKCTQEFHLNPSELAIETYRASSGPGGQHLNTTSSAVRITHKPSGLIVTSMKERCQHANKEIALKLIEAKLFKIYQEKIEKASSTSRQQQIKGSLRCEKIRTYNFPQNRITDHRLGQHIHQIDEFMSGKLLDKFTKEFMLQRALERVKHDKFST